MVYGQYEDAQIKQLSDFLVDWTLGRRREAISIPSQSPFHTLATEEEKIDYVTLVLLPVALELLALKTDPATVERAEERLREAGNNYPSEEEIRIEAHKVAGEDLSASTEWWEDVLNLRNAQAKRNLMKQEIRTELTNEELEAIGEVTRRNKKKISYKE